jgi:hypothetical protein
MKLFFCILLCIEFVYADTPPPPRFRTVGNANAVQITDGSGSLTTQNYGFLKPAPNLDDTWGAAIPAFVIDGTSTESLNTYGGGLVFEGNNAQGNLAILTRDHIDSDGSAATAAIQVFTGSAITSDGNTGSMTFTTGTSQTGNTGNINFFTGTTVEGSRGAVQFSGDYVSFGGASYSQLQAPLTKLTNDGSYENELRFYDSQTGRYAGLKAPATLTASKTYTLPVTDGSDGQFLKTNGSAVLSWASGNSGTVTSVSASVPGFLSISGSPVTTSGTLAISYSGTALPIANGGTGLTAVGSANQLFGTNAAGTAYEAKAASITAAGSMTIPSSQTISLPDGSNSAPSLTYTSDSNTGMYRIGDDDLGYAAGGTLGLEIKNIGSSLVNVGMGTAAGATSDTPFYALRTSNAPVYFQFGNGSTGTSSASIIQTYTGTGSNYFGIENWAYSNNSYYGGGSILRSGSNQTTLVIAEDYSSGDMRFTIGGPTLANEKMRINTGDITFKKPLKLNGSTSGTLTVQPAATTTSHTLTFPSAQGAANSYLKNDGSGGLSWSTQTESLGVTIDGAGSAILAGSKGYIVVPYDCTIQNWTIIADQSGSIAVDVLKSTYSGFPGSLTSIAGSELPTLSSAQKNQDLSLSTWTTSVSAGDIIQFNVATNATSVTWVNVSINVVKN